MESVVSEPRKRGRKRKRVDVTQNMGDGSAANVDNSKRRVIETRSIVFVGRYVKKEFEGSGVFLGKILSYDRGLYRVDYEDGDCEDLESSEVRRLAILDSEFEGDWSVRKVQLDRLIAFKYAKVVEESKNNNEGVVNEVAKVEAPLHSETDELKQDDDYDSSSDLSEYEVDMEDGVMEQVPIWPPPQLPPSSGNVGVPEEFVSFLFSVYCFLRSFSIRLFLSPFGLDDFVGSLNCVVSNTLLDAIHVAMLRLLRRHLEASSSDGSELASKCLRSIDWSLLDTLTWPVYLVHYLIVMDYTTGREWKGFFNNASEGEYYSLPAGRKLIILQILCDNIIDSEELRAEMDMREESEVGLDSESTMTTLPENGPRRVHPRYSKTSACKEREAMQIIAESGDTKICSSSKSVHASGSELAADGVDVDLDANGDECRLCGMDGTLLCCDGCPAAYHSRCIGVVKMYIPEGPWFCPECAINKTEPTITKGTFLKGAEVFGVDSYGQVFLGTCDHLLVFNISTDRESCPRYYNHNDIPKVLQVLSSEQHANIYYGICNAIQHYWEIPATILLMPDRIDSVRWPNTSIPLSVNGGDNVPHVVDGDPFASSAAKSRIERTALPCPENVREGTQNCFDMQPQLSALLNDGGSGDKLGNPSTGGQFKMESFAPKDSLSQQANQSELSGPDRDDRSSIVEFGSTSADHRMSSHQYVGGTISATNIYHQTVEVDRVGGRANSSITGICLYMGSSYKSQVYTNNYVHGEFAASAAANLTILSSEEMSIETLTSGNLRKTVSENIMQQVKAFSSAAIRFFWPISERKLAEVPRERCGWCFACKAPVSSKKACLLNSAVSNATKGALKILSGLRPIKSQEGPLPNIAMYILFMEESLRGLVIGPFLNGSFRKRWCIEVEQASTCSAIMGLLLQLEENIRLVAFSADWLKLVDDSSVGSSVAHNATNAVALTQKRGPGRRSKKHFALSDITSDDCHKFYCWWRGGRLSKNIFQKRILPRKMIRKVARLGGSRKIPGVGYTEGSEIPKRSRQCIWRAAVEMCKNTSQLALQVRYLDLHVRWADLMRPEQNVQDGKGPETEAAAFRNASICDKKFVENKIIYEVAFGNQKHLPSRVMKNKIAVDQCDDGTEKYWFYETHIPLYLIKEYEQQQSAKLFTPVSTTQPSIALSKLQRIQLKASRKDVYTYLTCKGKEKCFCASCRLDVLIRSAVKCSTCEGYCHARCTTSSKVHTGEEVEFLTTCKRCSRVQTLAQNENRNGSPTSPLPVQVQEYQNAVSVTKCVKKKLHNQPLSSGGAPDSGSNNKKKTTGSSSWATKSKQRKLCNWGLIWRKKNIQDTGIDFRLKNIMLKGSPDVPLCKPVCHLCHGPYNSNLMYIRCETCGHWYHADAVELEESKIFDLAGFKCCKCRRIRSPVCPHMDPDSRRLLEARKPRVRSSKQGNSGSDSIVSDSVVSEEPDERDPATPLSKEDVILGQDDDPLLFSLERVEHIADQNSEADFEWGTAPALGPQKLPVRRQAKREGDANGFPAVDPSCIETSVILETKGSELKDEPLSHLEWDASANDFEDDFMFDCEDLNCEDMEFEPQTYFSFQELLPSEDCSPLDGIDASADASGACEISSVVSPSGISAQPDLGLSNGVSCGICLRADLAPYFCCEVCKLCVHQHCCPWEENSSSHGGWKCGNCREWQ